MGEDLEGDVAAVHILDSFCGEAGELLSYVCWKGGEFIVGAAHI